jgi:large subunit ribosomal protein L9
VDIILLDAVDKHGNRGQVVKVKPGFARNFLFPRKLALPATDANRRVFQESERALVKQDLVAMEAARALAAKFADVSVTIAVQVGEEEKLYGSVTTLDITRKLREQGHEVDRRQIMLDEPIKQIGVFTVDLKLHREVSVPIKVWVVKE